MSRQFLTLLSMSCLVVIAGCLPGYRIVDSGRPTPGPARTPIEAVRLMEWSWDHRSTSVLEDLLTEDFRMIPGSTDSFPRFFGREDFLFATRRLFTGGPPPPLVRLDFDRNLVAFPDTRPGKSAPWHQEVLTRVRLTIDDRTRIWRVDGAARFFVVRGDSAVLQEGVFPDTSLWLIERIEDQGCTAAAIASAELRGSAGFSRSAVSAPLQAQPIRCTSWFSVLVWYRLNAAPALARGLPPAASSRRP